MAEWEEMKQMTLIEMDGFLKGKCIPSDLKVDETNDEYLVRKFGELESKLETALRECRSAGITIDNLEAKCAKMAAANSSLKQSEKEFNDFVAECKKLAYYDTGITPVYGDKLICLSTCEYTHPQQNGRLVVAAYRIS